MLREGSGSQLRVSITVSHHSDWWLTDCLCYTSKNCQGDKHQSSTRPWPSTEHFPFSSWLFIFYPVKPVLHNYQHFSYVTLIKWHLLVVVRWSINSPHGWWCIRYQILHDEVKQTLLRAGGEILPPAGGGQDCYIYSKRLTGGVKGWEAEVGP